MTEKKKSKYCTHLRQPRPGELRLASLPGKVTEKILEAVFMHMKDMKMTGNR